MTAIAHIIIDEAKDVLKVPNAALRYRPPEQLATLTHTNQAAAERHGSVVWVLEDDGRVASRSVKLGSSDAFATEVKSGSLNAGQTVIIGGATPRPNGWFSIGRGGS
jgi:HlyD family secretion protein